MEDLIMKWAMQRRVAAVGTLVFVAFVSVGLVAQTSRTVDVAFKAAQHIEEVEGNLRGAIDAYAKLVQGSDRVIAAQALVRMAGCYEKLGTAEAGDIYERVLRDYADQAEPVAEARGRLAALQQPTTVTPASAMVARRLTGAVAVSGSPSSDGRYLSTIDFRTGDVAVINVATGQIRALTDKESPWGNENVVNSVMSPSGDEVAYTWADYAKRPNYDLRVIATAEGAKPRILYSNDDVEWIRASDWPRWSAGAGALDETGSDQSDRCDHGRGSLPDGAEDL